MSGQLKNKENVCRFAGKGFMIILYCEMHIKAFLKKIAENSNQ